MLVCDVFGVVFTSVSHCVSILVLVDVGLRHELATSVLVNAWSFNPCFSGCWSATFQRPVIMTHRPEVSILVLVDVGLRPAAVCDLELFNISFNPCFSGCWSATKWTDPDNAFVWRFQSLF